MDSKPLTTEKRVFKTSAVELFDDGSRCYLLWFRVGNHPPVQKRFLHKGDLSDAIMRAREHCKIMDYRYCGCYPDIVDLDFQESKREDELGLRTY